MKSIKRYVKGFYMALGMFCSIPMPTRLWDDECADLMLPCFPLIGGLIGVLWFGMAKAVIFSGIHSMLVSAVLALAPFLLTGFLHLDGYMDTSDAVLSRRPLEEKLRILKDPHTGAFAVIMLSILFIFQFAAAYAAIEKGSNLELLVFIPVISRCCASMLLLCLKTMPQSGYANFMKNKTGIRHKIFTVFIAVCAIASSGLLAGACGFIIAAAIALGSVFAMAYAYKELGGVSGDLAGFSLVTGELCGLIALAIL